MSLFNAFFANGFEKLLWLVDRYHIFPKSMCMSDLKIEISSGFFFYFEIISF